MRGMVLEGQPQRAQLVVCELFDAGLLGVRPRVRMGKIRISKHSTTLGSRVRMSGQRTLRETGDRGEGILVLLNAARIKMCNAFEHQAMTSELLSRPGRCQ